MHPLFQLEAMAGAGPEGRAVFEAFLRAGQPVMLDLASPAADRLPEPDLWAWLASDRLAFMPTRFGLRLTPDQALRPEAGPALRRAGSLVLVADRLPRGFGENLRAWRARGMRLLWEYAPMAESLPEAALWDGILVRGVESGGRSRDYSVRVLFEHARRRLPPGLPIHVQGVEAPELAAVFIALGAAGVMADAGLVRLPAAGLADGERRALRAPLETCLRRRPDSDDWAEIAYTLPAAEPARNLAAGPGLFLAEAGAPEEPSAWMSAFRQRTASVLARLMDLAPEDLAAGVGDPAWIQGPMAFLSCSAPFARACREAGFFPVFSFTALAETEASALRDAVAGAEGIGAYGLGFAGPPAFDVPGLVRSLAARPPAALVLAADQWPRRQEFASLGIPLWLHVQKPEHARFALEQGVTTWIVEGNESGGHVGYLPGTVLWTLLLKTAAALDRPDLRVILAGGIVDEASVLFGLLLGRACGFRGRLSFQLGTALAAAPEAAAAGVVHPAYQRRLRQARRTRVLGPDTGAGLRAATDGAARPVPAAPSGPPEPGVALQAIASYRAALAGSEHDLVLAGEGVLALDRPLPLAELAGRLAAYAEAWRDCRGRLRPVETLDFRVARPLPALDLAIVGAGGLFPGAPDLRAFWDNLAANRRCIGEIPPDYWGAGEYHTPDPDAACRREARLTYTRSAGRLDFFRFDALDCLKFHLSPRAAEVADKIQLVLLKALDQALESAGPSLRLPADRTAVVVANSMGGETTRRGALRTHLADLLAVLARAPELAGLAPEQRDRLASRLLEELGAAAPPVTEDSMVGGSPSILAGRLAGFLGLRGGNYAVDAACAASLVGLATAVALIRSGQAEAAVLGGVDCELSVDAFISFCKLRALSRTISRPYMEDSDGFTMGEGGGVLLLKPFEQALRDGDPVLARIVGVGLSSDGRQGSLTLPQAEGQELAIRRCFDMSGFDPRSIRYIEGHGTGTAAGDAVELEVLGRVFAEAGPGRVILGTVKSLIGHLKSAAGMASLIKTALALHRRLLPPAWIEGTPHPVLRAPGCPLRLLAAPEPWRRDGFLPRRAAVSAFGFGGSNAHVHLEEMDETFRFLTAARLLLFSGADRAEVARRVADLAAAVEAAGFLDYADPRQLACLGGAGPCRLAMVWDTARPWPEARAALARALAGGDAGPDVWAADQVRPRPMVWLFPGQGVAAKPSFRQPAATVPLFADAVRAAEAHAGVPLFDTLWPGDRAPVELLFQARQPERQPAMVALSLALARVCRCLGLWPDAVAGHSLGFYSALAAAGALSEADALRLVRRRADCFAALGPDHAGCLVALAVDETAARTLAAESPVPAHVANMNSPRQTVLALRQSDADRFKAFLEARGVEYRLVPVGWAFHSPLVAPAAERFRAHLADAAFRRPAVAIYTERAGARIPAESFDGRFPDWLPAHLMDSIRFDRLVRTLAEDGFEVFLEIGAGGTLTRLVRDNLPPESVLALTLDSTAEDVVAHWHRVWARLYVEAGRDFDLGGYAEVLAGQLRPVRTGASAAAAVRPAGPAPVEIALPPAGAASAAAGEAPEADEVYARVRAIIARHTGFDEGVLAGNQAIQETLGVDSLKMMEIGLDLERAFGRPVLASALPQGLTLAGLAERIRNGEVFGSAAAAPRPPRRWVLVRRALPPAPSLAAVPAGPLRPAWLLTHDPGLAEAWREAGLGPVRTFDPAAGLPPAPAVFEPVPRALVLALRSSLLPRTRGWTDDDAFFALGHGLGQDWLPALRRGLPAAAEPFRVLTAIVAGAGWSEAGWPALTLSLQREFPGFLCRHATLEGRVSAAAVADRLRSELADPRPAHPVVICRKLARFAEHLEPADLSAGAGALPVGLSSEDAVLVTGGGRGITARVVRHLARTMKPTWILVGSTPPEAATPAGQARRETAAALREAGGKVCEWVCDFSREQSVRDLADRVRREFPRLAGVIHGAGVLADRRLEDKPPADFQRVMRVKAWSALLLERALDLSALKFWISFSSLTAQLGNEGQADYAAANAVLAAQAQRLKHAGVPLAKAILWSAWRGEGMAASEALQAALRARGVVPIEPEDGCRFLESELRAPDPAVVAFGGDPLDMAGVSPLGPDPIWQERRAAGASVRLVTRPFSEADPFLGDHRIRGAAVLPGVMALELSARALASSPGPCAWEAVAFRRLVRPAMNRLPLTVEWTARSAASADFAVREAGAADPAFSGAIRLQAYRRRAARPPAAGPATAVLGASDLYGPGGRLFAGPLFQVLMPGVRVGARLIKARFAGAAASPYADGAVAAAPVTAVDGLMQMAALWLLEHGHGACLPAGLDYAWWSGRPVPKRGLAALVWPVAGPEAGRWTFDGVALDGRQAVWVVKGLAMTPAGNAQA